MKKILFALFAILLSSFLATCDLFQLPPKADDALPGLTENERPMASLTINFEGTSRALINTDAPANANFYEVVFKDPNPGNPDDYYVKSFDLTAASTPALRTITIPAGDYTGSTKAVLFAGHYDGADYILLGIGIIDVIDTYQLALRPTHTGTAYLDSGSHSVTFKITALTSAVTAAQTNSSFKILGPTSDTGTSKDFSTGDTGNNPTITVGGIEYPIFPIPPMNYANVGTNFLNETENMIGQYTVDLTTHSAAVKLDASGWTVTAGPFLGTSPTYTTGGGAAPIMTVNGAGVTCTGDTPTTLSILSDVCTFKFMVDDLTNVTGNGLCQVLIDAPVHALATASTATYHGTATQWHIRPGIGANAYDGDNMGDNKGALIILDVGGPP